MQKEYLKLTPGETYEIQIGQKTIQVIAVDALARKLHNTNHKSHENLEEIFLVPNQTIEINIHEKTLNITCQEEEKSLESKLKGEK